MFFDNKGNLYFIKDDITYQVNISKDNELEYHMVNLIKYNQIKCNLLQTSDIHYLNDLENHLAENNDENTEYYLNYMTIGDSNDNENTEFEFYSNIDIPVFKTNEYINALYETIIINDNKILFRSKDYELPLYRIIVNLNMKKIFLKLTGGELKIITDLDFNLLFNNK